MPAAAASWKRVLDVLTPHPFHAGPAEGLKAPESPLHIASGLGVKSRLSENFLPVTNSARARRSAALRRLAMEIMAPVSSAASTCSGVMLRSDSREGARSLPPS